MRVVKSVSKTGLLAGEDESTDESAGLSAGLWVAIILGGLVVGALCSLCFRAVYRRRRKVACQSHVQCPPVETKQESNPGTGALPISN